MTPPAWAVEKGRELASKWCADFSIVPNGELATELGARITDALAAAVEARDATLRDAVNKTQAACRYIDVVIGEVTHEQRLALVVAHDTLAEWRKQHAAVLGKVPR